MRFKEIQEAISRRGFLRGLGAAGVAAAAPKIVKAQDDSDDEDSEYWGVRRDYDPRPKNLYPNIAVKKPDQYIPELNVVVYEGGIFNPMTYRNFMTLKKDPNPQVEPVEAGKIPGIKEKVFLTQLGDHNYYVTQSTLNKFVKEYEVETLSKRNMDIKQRMARGQWSLDKISKDAPNIQDKGSVQQPKFPSDINQPRNI